MKKFDAKKNMGLVVMSSFKEDIENAVRFTERKQNEFPTPYIPSHIATIVTFNPTNNEVEYFSAYSHNSLHLSESDFNSRIADTIKKIAEQAEYTSNELVAVIKTNSFEYYGYVGYISEEIQEKRELKLQNFHMSLYIDIITCNMALSKYLPKDTTTEEEALEHGTSIEILDISMRAKNCLKRGGYFTIEKVLDASLDDMIHIRNLGMRSLKEIENALGITFK